MQLTVLNATTLLLSHNDVLNYWYEWQNVVLQFCTEPCPARQSSQPSNIFFMLPHEIPLFMGRLCLDSWIPILVQACHWRTVILGLKSIKNSSGTNVFGTLDQVKWPFPKARKRVAVNQSTENSVWKPLWKFFTYRNQRVKNVTPT